MLPSAGVDALLDRLVAASESLRDAARTFATEHASDLVARREHLISSLRAAVTVDDLGVQQRGKLERAAQLGDEAREALLIKRETTRRELEEKVAGRRLGESFQPYRPKKTGSLNVKL